MGTLNQSTRNRLLNALNSMAVLDTAPGRATLLYDLPPALIAGVQRSDTKAVDLRNIVYACDQWNENASALRTMIETARDLVLGSTAEVQLQTVLDELNKLQVETVVEGGTQAHAANAEYLPTSKLPRPKLYAIFLVAGFMAFVFLWLSFTPGLSDKTSGEYIVRAFLFLALYIPPIWIAISTTSKSELSFMNKLGSSFILLIGALAGLFLGGSLGKLLFLNIIHSAFSVRIGNDVSDPLFSLYLALISVSMILGMFISYHIMLTLNEQRQYKP